MANAVKEPKSYGQKVAKELEEKEAELARKKAEKEAKAPSTNSAAAKSREKRAKRVPHPALKFGPDGNLKPEDRLKEYPADFDERVHLPLERKHFVNEAPWLLNRAEKAEKLAANLRRQAADAVKFGNAADRAKARRLRQMADVMAKLEAELAAQGIDVAELKGDAKAE